MRTVSACVLIKFMICMDGKKINKSRLNGRQSFVQYLIIYCHVQCSTVSMSCHHCHLNTNYFIFFDKICILSNMIPSVSHWSYWLQSMFKGWLIAVSGQNTGSLDLTLLVKAMYFTKCLLKLCGFNISNIPLSSTLKMIYFIKPWTFYKQISQGKKLNLPHVTQWCKDVYCSISPIYTMCKWHLNHNIHLVYIGEMEKYIYLHHCVTWGKFNFLPCCWHM